MPRRERHRAGRTMRAGRHALAVIVPARNAATTLGRCVAALRRSGGDAVDVVVVDDASTDGTARVAVEAGARVVARAAPVGPSAARNAGVRATTAEVVLFVDADVVVAPDAIGRVRAAFETDPDLAAVFGSYDATPRAGTLVSDYRNLLHHFVHQSSRKESRSFWSGCGAIRRRVFEAVGGFDERYRRPSIEDIELGLRCTAAGYRIRLDKRLFGTHLKTWTLAEVLRVDIRDRAYAWSRLIVERGVLVDDLNLQWAHRASAGLVWVGAASLGAAGAAATGWPAASLAGWTGPALAAAGLCAAGVVRLNRRFYGWLRRRRGWRFMAGAIGLHALYYAYSSATFAGVWLWHRLRARPDARPRPAAGEDPRRSA